MTSSDRGVRRRTKGDLGAHWRAQGFIPAAPLPEAIAQEVAKSGETRLIFSTADGVTETTTSAIHEEAGRIGRALLDRGLSAGDCVAVQLPPTREHMIILLACIRVGLVYIPILNTYGIAETRFILQQAQVKALFVPVEYRKTRYDDRVAQLDDIPDLLAVFTGEGTIPTGAVRWNDLLPAGAATPPDRTAHLDDVAAIVFTSGTTSDPKGVLHTNASLIGYCKVAEHYSPPDRASLNLVAIPGIGGMAYMLRPFLCGEGAIFVDHWDGAVVAELFREYRPWWTGGSPFHLQSILDATTPDDRASLRHCLVGGANVPPALIEYADTLGISACRSYGSSEHPVGACALDEDALQDRAYTDGALMPGTAVLIIDDDGNPLADGTPGEIAIKGPQLFAGYLNGALDAEAFTPDGWFKSGDIGVLVGDRLTVVDRKKDMLIRGGQNISSKEVEDILCRHPSVIEAAVIGWPDPVYGERVGAFLKTHDGVTIELGEIQQHFAAAGVARHKTPERIHIVEDFARNAGGKVLKNELRLFARTLVQTPT